MEEGYRFLELRVSRAKTVVGVTRIVVVVAVFGFDSGAACHLHQDVDGPWVKYKEEQMQGGRSWERMGEHSYMKGALSRKTSIRDCEGRLWTR